MSSFSEVHSPPVHVQRRAPNNTEDVLRSMLNDQSDHVFSKFSEAYIKVYKCILFIDLRIF
jgi:hypothetical protein